MPRDTRPASPTSPRGTSDQPRWGSGGHRDPVATIIAPRLGLGTIAAEHVIRSAPEQAGLIVAAMLDANAVERAYHAARPVLMALERIRPRPVREIVHAAALA